MIIGAMWSSGAVMAAALLVAMSGCGQGTAGTTSTQGPASQRIQLDADYPSFPSVLALTSQADAVVVGRVTGILSRERDGGADQPESSGRGIPMVFYQFAVQEVIKGDVADRDISVGWIDLSLVTTPDVSAIEKSPAVLLFLEHLTSVDAPGISTVTDFFVPLGADNGVFDVSGDVATARSRIVQSLGANSAARAALPLSFTLAEIRGLGPGK